MKRLLLVLLVPGCAAMFADRHPSPRAQTFAIVGATAVSAAAATGALLVHERDETQLGATIAASTIFTGALFLGDPPDEDPSTPGGIYRSLGSGLTDTLALSLTLAAPLVTSIATGGDVEHPTGAQWGAAGGIVAGMLALRGLGPHLPKWGRVALGAVMVGSLTALGFQLGGGGPARD